MRPLVPVLVLCLAPSLAAAEEQTRSLHPGWSPLLVPAAFVAPGLGHLLRGEKRFGGRMLAVSGAAFGVTLAATVFLGLSGAADVAAAVGIPVVLLGVSTLLTLTFSDIVGTFCEGPAPPLADTWSARARVGVSVLAPMHDREGPSPELYASWRAERWMVEGRFGATIDGPGPWLEGVGGFRLWGYSEAAPRAGLWVEAGVRYTSLDSARVLRGRAQLVSALPMGLFGERLSRLTSVLRLGVDPTWLWYSGPARPDFELHLSGGLEVRFVATEALRLVAGYEHARDGPVGGTLTGFLGAFRAGMELKLTDELLLVSNAFFGTPNAFTLGLEWRQ